MPQNAASHTLSKSVLLFCFVLGYRASCEQDRKGGVAISDTKPTERYELTPEQQEIVDDGLRILARMIARRFLQESARTDGHDAERAENDE